MPEIDEARLAAFADLQLLTVAEVAHLAQTGESWIRKGCQARVLPFTLVGDQYRFTREQVAELWRAKSATTVSVPSAVQAATTRRRAGGA